MRKIKVTAGNISETALLLENSTADAIWDALPIEATARIRVQIEFFIKIRHTSWCKDSQINQ